MGERHRRFAVIVIGIDGDVPDGYILAQAELTAEDLWVHCSVVADVLSVITGATDDDPSSMNVAVP